jgi:formylglycine-generating enzyme required for sulfatase activity
LPHIEKLNDGDPEEFWASYESWQEEQAAKRQERDKAREDEIAAATPLGWEFDRRTVPGLDLGLVKLPAGSFVMGSRFPGDKENPAHTVVITRPFWMGVYEITTRQYKSMMDAYPKHMYNVEEADLDRPVHQVWLSEAFHFAERLTEQEAEAGRLPEGYIYRSPTDAEWEYAYRCGTTGKHPVAEPQKYGEFADTLGKVGRFPPNPWGICDMYGNVNEWCLDSYSTWDSLKPLIVDGIEDPVAVAGTHYVYRSGRDAVLRHYQPRASVAPTLGFRIVLGPADILARVKEGIAERKAIDKAKNEEKAKQEQ